MVIFNDNALEINNLVETLRHEPPMGAVQSKSIHALFAATTARSSDSQRANEVDIQAVFDNFDTKHPAHNAQRSYALKTLALAKFGNLDLDRDKDAINAVIKEIDARKLTIKPQIATASLADLSERLTQYSTITSTNTVDFPHLELLGHRRDATAHGVFTKLASAGTLRNEQKQRMNLAAINANLDEIVPRGSYYNIQRQFVVDTLLRHKDGLAAWSANEKTAKTDRARSGNTGFIANNAHYRAEEAVKPIRAMLAAMKSEHSQEIGPAKAFTPLAIVRIAHNINAHRGTLPETGGQPSAKRQKMMPSVLKHVPPAISRTVTITPRNQPVLRADAQKLALDIAKSVNKIVVPRRGNFQSRAHFLTTVYQHRAELCANAPNDQLPAHHNPNSALDRLKSSYNQAFSTKRDDIGQLAQKLQHYHAAWHSRAGASLTATTLGQGAINQARGETQPAITGPRTQMDERLRQHVLQR